MTPTLLTLAISVDLSGQHYYKLPPCITNATNLATANFASFDIDDFSVIASATVSELNFQNCKFSSGIAGSGMGSDSSITWDEFWSFFSMLNTLSIYNSNLVGTLPTVLPALVSSFKLDQNMISGTIPASLLSLVATKTSPPKNAIILSLTANKLTGSIPEGLFNGFNGAYATVSAWFSNNLLTGTFPAAILQSLENRRLISLSLDFSFNGLTGTLPERFVPLGALSNSAAYCSLTFSSNLLTGSVPNTLLGDMSSIVNLILKVSNNSLTGSIPFPLFSNAWNSSTPGLSISIDFSQNQLSGSIPPTWLTNGLTSLAVFGTIILDLHSNWLSGTIPNTLFYVTPEGSNPIIYIRPTSRLEVALNDNAFEGSLPSALFDAVAPLDSQFIFKAFNNPSLSGTIPDTLLEPISAAQVTFDIHNTSIYGSPPSKCWSAPTIVNLFLSSMLLNGVIPTAWRGCQLTQLDISRNFYFAATIPEGIFNISGIRALFAYQTPLYGTLPSLPSSLASLALDVTNLDFCNSTSLPVISRGCSLLGTSACDCSAKFVPCSISCLGTPFSVDPFPNIPALLPYFATPAPSPLGSNCDNRTRPSVDFYCSGGVWALSATNSSVITIPSGAGTVLVTGNITSTTLIFAGFGSTVLVNGSILNLNTITIVLSPADAKTLGGNKVLQILVNTSGSNSSTDLSLVNVNTKVTSGCRKVKSEKATFDGGKTLGVYLSVDSSGCNTWWIILVSVVVAVIVIAAAVLVLLAVFYPPFRLKIRPYSGRRNAGGGAPKI